MEVLFPALLDSGRRTRELLIRRCRGLKHFEFQEF